MYNFTQCNSLVFTYRKNDLVCHFATQRELEFSTNSSDICHFHSCHELHLPIDQKITIATENKNISVAPGQVCIVPPNVLHHITSNNVPRISFRFIFPSGNNIFARTFGNMTKADIFNSNNVYDKYIRHANDNIRLGIPSFIIADLLFCAMYEIALQMNSCDNSLCEDPPWSVIVSENIENFINTHYNKNIQLNDLADNLNLGIRQTQRLIEKHFGMPFNTLLNKKRLLTAQFLLRTTDTPIDDIAYECGFESMSYFYRKFSSMFDITPGKYRKENKKYK